MEVDEEAVAVFKMGLDNDSLQASLKGKNFEAHIFCISLSPIKLIKLIKL